MDSYLDPLFIMGFGPVPAMGIKGAAVATVLSQFVSAFVVLAILSKRHGLILFARMSFTIFKTTWALIIRYAIPSTIGMLMMPHPLRLDGWRWWRLFSRWRSVSHCCRWSGRITEPGFTAASINAVGLPCGLHSSFCS